MDDGNPRYELSWTWVSAGMNCHAALETIGVPYSLRFIDFDKPWPEDDLALNPNHKVPTLIDRAAGNLIVYQSAAILLYLAENHLEANLLPETGTPARGKCFQWLFFMAEMLQPSFHMFYYPERHTTLDDSASHQAIQAKAIEWIDTLWGRIDQGIGNEGGGEHFLGSQLSVCDLYMLPMAVWNKNNREFPPIDGYKNLSRVLSSLFEQPSVQTVLRDHVDA